MRKDDIKVGQAYRHTNYLWKLTPLEAPVKRSYGNSYYVLCKVEQPLGPEREQRIPNRDLESVWSDQDDQEWRESIERQKTETDLQERFENQGFQDFSVYIRNKIGAVLVVRGDGVERLLEMLEGM